MRTTKATSRLLAVVMALVMALSCTAMAAPNAPAAPELSDAVTLSLSENTTIAVSVPVSADVLAAAQAEGATVTWTLERVASYANPAEGFKVLLGESEMYPNEPDVIDPLNVPAAYQNYLTVNSVKTVCEPDEEFDDYHYLTMELDTTAMQSRGNASAPHANGGAYLDVCGEFRVVPTVNGTKIASDTTMIIKPYAGYHTMWEIYAELDRLSTLGDDNANTAAPYVVKESMGQSNLGYDMPYLIIAKDSETVSTWLALCARAETDPDGLAADLEKGLIDYKVPVVYSNIHANEVAAADGILKFAQMLVENETIEYNTLTGFTEEGQAKLAEQREALGLHTSELIEDMTSFLGGILPDESVAAGSQKSGSVDLDAYYTQEMETVNVDELLDDVFFILVPEENVEGRMYVTRYSSGGYDLNRDNSFQTQAETQNMQQMIGTYNPVTLLELHGQVVAFQAEPCSPPHEPNFEYDLLSNYLMPGGEAFGAAAVANNLEYNSYVIPMRDYLTSDASGNPDWTYPWDDMSTSYTPQFAMLQGCVAYTVELPAYSQATTDAACYGLVGLSQYVAENKDGYFTNQLEIYSRCLNNQNTDNEVGPWLVDAADTLGAEADLFRPAYDGEGQNGQFFPECYIIPLDSVYQSNLQAAYDMIEWLTRNDVKVGISTAPFTYDGVTYPEGTMVVSMYQAKRAVANGVLYQGTVIRDWNELYSEGITAFNYTRGFDMVTCAEPAAYETIKSAVGTTLDYESALAYLAANAKTQLSGDLGGDVIISNSSEDAVAAVNALLQAGKAVGMVTEGKYEGDFICSYSDFLRIKDAYVLTATGIANEDVTAYVIEAAPVVYINGTSAVMTPSASGYVNTTRITNQAYNYDRMAMEIMNFTTTTDASLATAVIGANALDAAGLAAVQAGVPYIGYTNNAVRTVNEKLVAVSTGSTAGMDCLGFVEYPEKTLVNASYINEGDNVFYGYGTSHFTSLPVGAQVLVQGTGEYPMEGFLNGDAASLKSFLKGVKMFAYQGEDMNGNEINMVLSANTLTNKAHQRDEYAFLSNFIFSNMLTEQAYVTNTGFVDVPADQYYAEAVVWAVDNNITTGTSATTFSPNDPCTRAQVVTFLWREAGQPAPTSTVNPFTDVAEGSYYYEAVLWAVENGITNGMTETTFAPDATINRSQAVTFLWRNAGEIPSEAENPFSDVAADTYYEGAVLWAVETGVTTGTSDTTFSPDANCIRAQIVTFMYRAMTE
ncbi:MAG: S-layer homology domain-containing protein [Ruminiclostridium sp.]|nr:S-layer homology domain-containing protein [Ruminiclostridium sp.]